MHVNFVVLWCNILGSVRETRAEALKSQFQWFLPLDW